MKVKISYTVDVDDRARRAINFHYGKPGLADREEVADHFKDYGSSAIDDFCDELDKAEKSGEIDTGD